MASVSIRQILEDKINKEGETWPFRLIELDGSKDTIETALRKLGGHKILAAPVKLSNGKYLLIDMETIVSHVNESKDPQALFQKPIESICIVSPQNQQMDVNDSLLTAINLLASKSQRVLVVEDDKPVGIVTHMDIIKFVVKNWNLLPQQILEEPISSISTANPVLVHHREKLGEALRRITMHHFGGAAVVDDSGSMIANLSTSDLRNIMPENIRSLLESSVESFLKQTKRDLLKIPITCTEKTTFFEVVKLMNQNHIHRVHVLNESKKPSAVCSTTDVLVQIDSLLG